MLFPSLKAILTALAQRLSKSAFALDIHPNTWYNTRMNINENKQIDHAFNSVDHLASLGLDLTFDQFLDACHVAGINMHKYLPLADEMYWDGHTIAELIQQIEVLEGDCSI